MSVVADFTAPEKILLAASQLENKGQSPFSAEALIVASWKENQRTFGLKGYEEQYPDSNKVLSCIMGVKGLAGRGWLSKMGQKLYTLSREGQMVVHRLKDGDEAPPQGAVPAKLSRDQEKYLLGLLSSTAVAKMEEGLMEELAFADATRFWGITENLAGDALIARLDRLRATLADVGRIVGTASVDLSNGRSISKDDLDWLASVHDYLEKRFNRHLTLLRTRTGRE